MITQQEVLYGLPELMETTGAEPNASSCNIINWGDKELSLTEEPLPFSLSHTRAKR